MAEPTLSQDPTSRTAGDTATTEAGGPHRQGLSGQREATGAAGFGAAGAERATAATERQSDSGGTTLVGRVRERAGAQLAVHKDRASDNVQSIVRAVRDVTQRLRDDNHESIADYTERAAAQLERASARLKSKDIGELFRDAQHYARQRPAVFIGSAFVLGLLGARFLKSSTPNQRTSWQRLPADLDGNSRLERGGA